MNKLLENFVLPTPTDQVEGYDLNIDEVEPTPLDNVVSDELEQYRGTVSDSGEIFDPLLHVAPPKQTAKGAWRKKRTKKVVNDIEDTAPVSNAIFNKVSKMYASVYANLHKVIYSNGADFVDKDIKGLSDSIERFMLTYGFKDLSPKADVILSCLLYTGVIIGRKENEAVNKNIKNKIKSLFFLSKKDKVSDKVVNKKESNPSEGIIV